MTITLQKIQRIRETYKQLGAEVLAAIHGVTVAEIRAIVRGPKKADNGNAPSVVPKPAAVASNPFQKPAVTPTQAQVQQRDRLRDQVGATGYVPLMCDAYRRTPR